MRAKALANLGTVVWFSEDHAEATALYEAALAEGAFDTERDRASVLFNLGLLAGAQPGRALDLQRRAATIYDHGDHAFNLAMAWIGLGWTHLDVGGRAGGPPVGGRRPEGAVARGAGAAAVRPEGPDHRLILRARW